MHAFLLYAAHIQDFCFVLSFNRMTRMYLNKKDRFRKNTLNFLFCTGRGPAQVHSALSCISRPLLLRRNPHPPLSLPAVISHQKLLIDNFHFNSCELTVSILCLVFLNVFALKICKCCLHLNMLILSYYIFAILSCKYFFLIF